MRHPSMTTYNFSSWEEEKKHFKLDYIPEMIKFLCYQGYNYQEILYNYEVVGLLKYYNFPEDFWSYLVKINYEKLFYIWAFQGPVNIDSIITKLERSPEKWAEGGSANSETYDWSGFLSPLEVDKLKAICAYKKFTLEEVQDGALYQQAQPKERLLNYLYQIRVELINFYEVFLPFGEPQVFYRKKEVSV